MTNDSYLPDMAHDLGYEGVENLVGQAGKVCAHARREIELANEAKIVGLELYLAQWSDEEKRISERLRCAPPPGDRRAWRRKAWYAAAVAACLTMAGFFLSLVTFDPFRFGWKSYLYCIGVAVVSPFLVEKCLEEWDCRRLIQGIATIACLAAITSLGLLAVIRGDLIVQQMKEAEAQVVVTGDNPTKPQNDNQFYDETLPYLRSVMALLAIAMELGAGLALLDAKRFGADSGEDAKALTKELMAAQSQIAALASEISDLSTEGQRLEQRFWHHFYRAMLTHTARKALGKWLVLVLSVLFLGSHGVWADGPRQNLVVLMDLSVSVASKGPDGTTNFEKNVSAIGDLLAHVPAGSRVTVLGITATSFAEPDILLQAQIPEDVGYFGERLTAAHRQLIRAWRERAARVAPNAKQTDILGALLVASQIFRETSKDNKRVLVIYSDMRQATLQLNLEARTKPVDLTLQLLKRDDLMSDLSAADVYVLGCDASGKSPAYWENLSRFWAAYLKAAGANLRRYSFLRERPDI